MRLVEEDRPEGAGAEDSPSSALRLARFFLGDERVVRFFLGEYEDVEVAES